MINCEEAMRELWGYLFEEIAAGDRHRVTEHLDACRRCCGELEFLGELRRFVATAQPALPADVGDRMDTFLAALEGSTLEGSTLEASTLEGPDGRPDVSG
jgi:Putative zinc-finger